MRTPAVPLRVLDTDVLIDIQRRHPPAVAWYASLRVYPTVPGVVIMELIQDARNKLEVERTLRLVKPLPVAWPTNADCARALHLSHNLGLIDSLIAATTLGLGATLCTFNVKHYRSVAGLVLKQLYKR